MLILIIPNNNSNERIRYNTMKRILMSKTVDEVNESANQVRHEIINKYRTSRINRDQYKRLMNRVTLMEESAKRRIDIMIAALSIGSAVYDIDHMVKIFRYQEDKLYQLNYEFTGLITSLDAQDQKEVYDFTVQFDNEICNLLSEAIYRMAGAR